jgi:hypothetical protein
MKYILVATLSSIISVLLYGQATQKTPEGAQPFTPSRIDWLTACNALGKFTLSDYCVEFFPLLKRCEKRECFAVSCYRARQFVERRGVFGCLASCYLGVR